MEYSTSLGRQQTWATDVHKVPSAFIFTNNFQPTYTRHILNFPWISMFCDELTANLLGPLLLFNKITEWKWYILLSLPYNAPGAVDEALSVHHSGDIEFLFGFSCAKYSRERRMMSLTKLHNMARKSSLQNKRTSFPRNDEDEDNCCSTSMAVDKGHFVAYTADRNRFVIPLACLHTEVFRQLRQLLQMSEDEFGLPSDGLHINYIIPLIQRGVDGDIQEVLLISVANSHCSSSSPYHKDITQLLLVYWLTGMRTL